MTEHNLSDKTRLHQTELLSEVPLEAGDRIEWTYEHHLNSRSFTHITKIGVYIRKIKHKRDYLNPQAVVKFDDNKNTSQIKIKDIVLVHKNGIFYCSDERKKGKCIHQCNHCYRAVRR